MDNNPVDEINQQLNAFSLSVDNTMGFITLSQKDAPQLYYDGHFFRDNTNKNVKGKGNVNWRCVKTNCNVTCQTASDNIGRSFEILKIKGEHIEAPDAAKLKKLEYRRQLKEMAKNTDEAPRKIITKAKSKTVVNDEVIANQGSYEADTQYPPEPKDLSDINMPEFLNSTLTNSNTNFLIYDSGNMDKDRFFIFGNVDQLKLLEDAHLFCDGTFNIAPKLFQQVYSIHVLYNGRCIPIVYALLPPIMK
ncbi:FLYWCH zinc finger domain [Brachionus plicatilis]|uniref:FLYWCH zinc finger domain n=1 Tax=Brachionus plicatilis TaxID=10195 RepID=A0A3M7SJB7_BRAPC|nr:FLYWCH zinc finger domain [Brachionus plicatilis]